MRGFGKIDEGCFETVLAMWGYRNPFLQVTEQKNKKCHSFSRFEKLFRDIPYNEKRKTTLPYLLPPCSTILCAWLDGSKCWYDEYVRGWFGREIRGFFLRGGGRGCERENGVL